MIKRLLPYRIALNHKPLKSKKETANHPDGNRNYFPPSLRHPVSGKTSADTGNNLNKRAWSPPRSGQTERQDVLMEAQAARSSTDPSLLSPAGKKRRAGNSIYEERGYEGSTELTHCFLPASASFWRSLTENNCYKINIILAGSFSKNCCIHAKSQNTSVLQSLKQLKALLTFLNF